MFIESIGRLVKVGDNDLLEKKIRNECYTEFDIFQHSNKVAFYGSPKFEQYIWYTRLIHKYNSLRTAMLDKMKSEPKIDWQPFASHARTDS